MEAVQCACAAVLAVRVQQCSPCVCSSARRACAAVYSGSSPSPSQHLQLVLLM
eukprot:CAMPEP_0202920830 /NCGR_PEP_ID=MMETSP1392-20130828/77064_1 /ASSEMBLY_ACC=CAM_ASM_000868 /TAXON_ID=225041 /ORGANISM="Chlamydomonas chlamydogama, Strain SAG 11-48b" /LENGTH=52 /DNA_ID=CAMNT_0049614343 /DNA_START=233 /DNA_END=391 /DNA_ORIENTATION=-